MHLKTKQRHWYVLRSVSASFFQLKQLRLGLGLSLVCETGGKSDFISQNSELLSHNSDFISQNSELLSHNSDFISQNSELLSHNSDFVGHNFKFMSHNSETKVRIAGKKVRNGWKREVSY